jgi:hypothetical protein
MKSLILLVLALVTFNARADVAYEWNSVNGATPYNISFELIFSDQVAADGHIKLNIPQYSAADPSAGLTMLHYQAPNPAVNILFKPTQQSIGIWSVLDLDLALLDDGTLSGSIYANNNESHITMKSVGNLFTVTSANSDRGDLKAGCGVFENCAGATGKFVLAPDYRTVQAQEITESVPEPATLALTGFGMVFLIGRRRRS